MKAFEILCVGHKILLLRQQFNDAKGPRLKIPYMIDSPRSYSHIPPIKLILGLDTSQENTFVVPNLVEKAVTES
jgi:hypothetical protein